MLSFLLLVACTAFGPAMLIALIRLASGPRAARGAWRKALRWLYLAALTLCGFGLGWWAWIDGVAETDTGIQFGIASMLTVLVAFSGAVSWTVAGTRWVRMDGGTILR
ncbi:hypothetical protein MKK64_18990 [Methylobacterium sp. E-025]|uniref:hypothetical protein n=1 Tax=Methylobacterium sp. E-025 TaxID=2836561 RepID=UPI001FBBA0E2|nr:hypothetical protein [Methylobacterium sp. E-025]MCJ2113268.1 hypothetical protein [Methylobacterium sp. E-025]